VQGGVDAGELVAAGLPDITVWIGVDGAPPFGGAFSQGGQAQGATGASYNNKFVNFSAAASNPIDGSSDTVQPPAQRMIFLIRYQ
jgi:hypothetical protein